MNERVHKSGARSEQGVERGVCRESRRKVERSERDGEREREEI